MAGAEPTDSASKSSRTAYLPFSGLPALIALSLHSCCLYNYLVTVTVKCARKEWSACGQYGRDVMRRASRRYRRGAALGSAPLAAGPGRGDTVTLISRPRTGEDPWDDLAAHGLRLRRRRQSRGRHP